MAYQISLRKQYLDPRSYYWVAEVDPTATQGSPYPEARVASDERQLREAVNGVGLEALDKHYIAGTVYFVLRQNANSPKQAAQELAERVLKKARQLGFENWARITGESIDEVIMLSEDD